MAEPTTKEDVPSLREQHYNATIEERIDVHEELIRLRIRPDIPFPPFEAGQYVAIGLGRWEPRMEGTQDDPVDEKSRRKIGWRAYSISCPMIDSDNQPLPVDAVDYLEFYVVLVREASSPEGKPPVLTPRLFLKHAGDRLKIQKKIVGTYTLRGISRDDTVLMLGTGTGEAPHNAMATTLLAGGHRGKIVNVGCVRMLCDVGYADEHDRLMKRFPNYRYIALTTREPHNLDRSRDDFVGKQYIQDQFKSGELSRRAGLEFTPETTHVFLCGNPAMIGYVPPGSPPPDSPGMLPILRDAGFADAGEIGGPGTIRFEKYW